MRNHRWNASVPFLLLLLPLHVQWDACMRSWHWPTYDALLEQSWQTQQEHDQLQAHYDQLKDRFQRFVKHVQNNRPREPDRRSRVSHRSSHRSSHSNSKVASDQPPQPLPPQHQLPQPLPSTTGTTTTTTATSSSNPSRHGSRDGGKENPRPTASAVQAHPRSAFRPAAKLPTLAYDSGSESSSPLAKARRVTASPARILQHLPPPLTTAAAAATTAAKAPVEEGTRPDAVSSGRVVASTQPSIGVVKSPTTSWTTSTAILSSRTRNSSNASRHNQSIAPPTSRHRTQVPNPFRQPLRKPTPTHYRRKSEDDSQTVLPVPVSSGPRPFTEMSRNLEAPIHSDYTPHEDCQTGLTLTGPTRCESSSGSYLHHKYSKNNRDDDSQTVLPPPTDSAPTRTRTRPLPATATTTTRNHCSTGNTVPKSTFTAPASTPASMNGWISNRPARQFVAAPAPKGVPSRPSKSSAVTTQSNQSLRSETTPLSTAASDYDGDGSKSIPTTTKLKPTTHVHKTPPPPSNTANDGPYCEVVRNRVERQALQPHSCQECGKFLDAIMEDDHEGVYNRHELMCASRHRYRFTPPDTPVDFWELSFIDERDARLRRECEEAAAVAVAAAAEPQEGS